MCVHSFTECELGHKFDQSVDKIRIHRFIKQKIFKKDFLIASSGRSDDQPPECDREFMNNIQEFIPITVDGLPRSGTTRLMQLIAGHPEIVTYNAYPFEYRFAIYWLHMLKILRSPTKKPYDNWAFQKNFESLISHPYFPWLKDCIPWFEKDYSELLQDFCKKSINSFYSYLSRRQKKSARFFVEKFPGIYKKLLKECFPTYREIIIVRDVRDVYCSIVSFNKLRKSQDFYRDKFSTEKEYFVHLCTMFKHFFNYAYEDEGSRFLIKYEDMIKNPQEIIVSLFSWLGVNCDLDEIMENLFGFSEQHITSKDIKSSVFRWKKDLDKGIAEIAEQLLAKEFATLNYPTLC